nr:M3 family oligoendopeptidase [Ardenticatena sp.]
MLELPNDYQTFLDWTWDDLRPYYEALQQAPLTEATVDTWLQGWSALDERIHEIYARLYVTTTQDTTDEEAEARFKRFLSEVYPHVQVAEQALKQKLLASGLRPEGFELPLKRMETEARIFREENVPLFTEERNLTNEYNKITGAQTVEWEGEERTLPQMRPLLQEHDRDLRERAWRAMMDRQLADREALNDLWQRLLDVREQQARNAGFATYRDFRWQQLARFDYTPDDCRTFHQAIEDVVVPAALRIYERRRQLLGVETLRPWDLDVDPALRPPLRPFQSETELIEVSARIFHRVDETLGGYFDIMCEEGCLDLANRKGKGPGGYCIDFPVTRRPFIFMNAVGLQSDVRTMMHEAGHAFHTFEAFALPYIHQRDVGMEFAEVASMAMELLSAPYWHQNEGGFYDDEDYARARIEHLEGIMLFWPYMAVVDAFQHWVYENMDLARDPAACDAKWRELWDRFMPGVDWRGLEDAKATGWHRKLHIFTIPFYYVEYGLAELGSVQVWANALHDQAAAVRAYRAALALGGTRSLPELYATAGARFAFDHETMRSAITLLESQLDALYKVVV